tara:strand:+ start:249 stop:950 length:702 start_codon:yes stop_codon:yes gene_type:complete
MYKIIDTLYSLSLKKIGDTIQGNLTQSIQNINTLNINNNCKQDIIVYLEKTEINDFINCEENSKGLIFEYYVNSKDIEKIKILLKYYPDYVNINNTDYFGQTPLFIACESSNYKISELLLQNNADPDAHDYEDSETPLMQSSFNNNLNITSLLLEYGADCDLQNRFNLTALHIACMKNNLNIVNILLNYGANCYIKSSFSTSETPLQIAIKNKYTEIEELLREYINENENTNK